MTLFFPTQKKMEPAAPTGSTRQWAMKRSEREPDGHPVPSPSHPIRSDEHASPFFPTVKLSKRRPARKSAPRDARRVPAPAPLPPYPLLLFPSSLPLRAPGSFFLARRPLYNPTTTAPPLPSTQTESPNPTCEITSSPNEPRGKVHSSLQ
jgi:hypothetical protein